MTSIDKTLVAARFSRAAGTYDDEAEVQRRVAGKLLELVREHHGGRIRDVLEIGCGTGYLSRLVREAFQPRRLLLNDICPSLEGRLGDLLEKGAVFVPGDAESRRFGADWDLVIASSVVQWFVDPASFFARCRAAAKADACLAFATYGPENMHQVARVAGVGLRYRSLREWTDLLGGAWRVIAVGEERIDRTFAAPLDVLRHMRRSGVTGVGRRRWTPGALRRFEREYARLFARDGVVPLTYHPLYVVARARG